jgi:PAS domain S-box-containing protein
MRRFPASGLRLRLLLLVLITLVPALGLAYSTGQRYRHLAALEAQNQAQRLVQLVSANHVALVEGAHQLLVALAQVPQVQGGDPAACNALLDGLLEEYPVYANLGVAGPQGDMVCSAVPFEGPISAADRLWFQRALQTRDFSVGEYQVSRATGQATLNFAYPIPDEDGAVQAVVVAALDLAWLNQLTARTELPPGATLTLFDGKGVVLARYPDPEGWVGRSAAGQPMVQEALARRQAGVAQLPGLNGTASLFGFAPLDYPPGEIYISIGIPAETAFAEADRIGTQNLVWLGIVGALALIAAWAAADLFLLRPTRALLAATQRLAAGDLGARSGLPDGQGELSQLGRAFDAMAGALQARTAERERAEAALRETTETLQAVIQASPLAIITLDLEGNVDSVWNPAAERMFGWSRQEVLGHPLPTIPAGKQQEFDTLRRQVVGGEAPSGVELRRLRKDGSPVNVSLWTAPLRDAGGAAVGIVGLLADITGRQQAEAALHRYTRQLEALRQVGLELASELNLDSLLHAIVSEAVELVGGTSGDLTLYRPERDVLELAIAAGSSSLPVGFVFGRGEGLSGNVWQSGRPLIVNDYQDWEGRLAIPEAGSLKSVLGVPVRWRDDFLGTLVVTSDTPKNFTSQDGELLGLFAAQAAVAIHNARLFEEVRAGREQLRQLAGYLQAAREAERAHIAREIHDEFGQALTALKIDLAWIAKRLPEAEGPLREKADAMSNLVDDTIRLVRRIATELRPGLLDDLGLRAAIEWQAGEFAERTGIPCDLRLGDEDAQVDPHLATAVFRIFQETLTNIARHAGATRVRVLLEERPDQVVLVVQDNGQGISQEHVSDPASLGLAGMRERARACGGEVTFEGVPGQGTTVRLWVPRPAARP